MLLFGILKTFVYILIIYNKDFVNYSEAVEKSAAQGSTPSVPKTATQSSVGDSSRPPKPASSTPSTPDKAEENEESTPSVKTETQSDGSIIVSTESPPKVEPGVEEVSKISEDAKEALSKIKMAVLKDDGETRYIEPNDYELLKFHKELLGFVFKQGVKCLGFKHGNQMVWRYDPNRNQCQYPKSIVYKPDKLLYVDFGPKHHMFKYDQQKEQWKLSTDESYTGSGLLADMDHPKYLNIMTSETLGCTVLKQNDTTKYKIYGYSNRAFLYVFNSDAVCREFRFKDSNVIWRYDKNKHGSRYPRSISVDMSTALAHFEFTDKVESIKLSEDKLIQYPFAGGITYYTETELKARGLSTLVPGQQGQQSTPKGPILVTLDLDTKMDTSPYNYLEDHDLNTETYTAKPGYKFEKIKRGDNDVWTATNKKYYTEVKLSVDTKGEVEITLSASDQPSITISEKPKSVTTPATPVKTEVTTPPTTPVTVSEDSKPTPTTPTTPATPSTPSTPSATPAKKAKEEDIPELKGKKPVVLDIRKSADTEDMEFSKYDSEDLRIYKAKNKFVFSKVFKAKHSCNCAGSDTEIWEATNKRYYVTKVILKGSGDKPKYLLMLPLRGDFMLYYKDKKGGDWRDITPLRMPFSDFRFFGSEKAGSGVRELYHKHYDKSAHKFMFGYLFKKDIECSQIKYKDMTLWTYTNKSEDAEKPDPHPIGLYYEMFNKNLYLLFPDNIREMLRIPTTIHKSKLMLSVTTPTTIDFSNRKPVVLDIEKDSDTEHMEYTKNATEDIRVYNAKEGYLFDKVIKKKTIGSDENVWHTDYKNEYAWRVIIKGSGKKPKYLLMLPAVGDYMLYYQQKEDHPWKDITSLALSFSDLRFFGTEKDGSDVKQFDYKHYDRATLKFMFGYKFEDNVKCSQIKYKDEAIWTYNTSKTYPLGLYYDFANKNLHLLLPENKLEQLNIPVRHHLVLGSYISSAVQIIAETPAIDPLVMLLPSVTIFTYGSTQPNDRTKYNLTTAVDIATFEFKDDAECTEVDYRGEIVWKHDFNRHKQVYPKFVTIYLRSATVLVSLRDDYLYVYKHFNKQWLTLFSGIPHPIQLNIKNHSSCEEYEYVKVIKVGTFTAKDNVVFQEVIKPKGKCCGSDHVLHKAENFSQYVFKVVIDGLGDKGKKIRLHLLNGRVLTVHMLRNWYGKSQGYCPYGVPIIRVVTRDSTMPNDTAKYDIFTSDDNKNYVFKPEEMCTKLLVDDDVVWAHGPRTPYPKSVSYDKKSQMFVLKYEHEDVIFRREGFGWQKESVRTSSLSPLQEFITLATVKSKFPPISVKLDINKSKSGKYMEYSKDKAEDLKVYTANAGYVFSKIVKKTRVWYSCWLYKRTKDVWDAPSPSHYATKVILKGTESHPKYLLMIPVVGDYILYYKEKKDTPWRDITSNRLSFSDFRFFGPDKTGSGVRELYHKHYERATRKFSFGYRFKDNVKCSEIKYKDESIWAHDTGKTYPYGLYYDMVNKNLYVQYPGPKWERQGVGIKSETKVAAPATPSTTPVTVPTSTAFTELTSLLTIPKHKSRDDQEELDSGQKFSLYEIKIVTEGSDHPNDHTKYERKEEGDVVFYKFEDGARCTHVGYEYQLVWTHDPAKHQQVYPESVMVFVRTKVMFVIFKEGFVYVYKHFNNKWHILFVGKPDPIQLDIKSKKTHQEFDYFYDSNTKTGAYVAKGNVVFQEVIRKKPSCESGSDTFLLQADKHLNSAYKVVIDGVGDKKKKVWLYLLNGEILHLCKKTGSCGKVEGWVSCKPDIKIVTYGSFDANDTTKYDLKEENDVINYLFKPEGRCTEILFDDKTVWSHEDNDTYPRSIIYGDDEKSFLLTFGDQNVVYKKQQDGWSPGLIDLNIMKTKSTEFFTYTKDEKEDLRVFTANAGYVFSKIVKKTRVWYSCWLYKRTKDVWDAPSPSHYAYKVILKGTGGYPRYLLLLPVRGDYMSYYKEKKDTPWRDITSNRLSFSDFTFFSLDKSGYRVRELGHTHYERSTFKFMFGYQFKDGVKCSKIMYKRETIWVHHDPSKPNPLGLYYDLISKELKLLYPGPEWELSSIQIEVDIDKVQSGFYYTAVDTVKKTRTFTPGKQYLIQKVKQGENLIWQNTDLEVKVEKVFYEGVGENKRKVTIYVSHKDSKDKHVFEKSSSTAPWKEVSSGTPSTVPSTTEDSTVTTPAKAEEDTTPSALPESTPATVSDDTTPSTTEDSTVTTPAKAEEDTTPTKTEDSTVTTPAKAEEDTTPSALPESTPATVSDDTTPSTTEDSTVTTPAKAEEDTTPSALPESTPATVSDDTTPSTTEDSTVTTPAKAEEDTTPTKTEDSTVTTPAKAEEDTTPSALPESTPATVSDDTTPSTTEDSTVTTPAKAEEDTTPSALPESTPATVSDDTTPSTTEDSTVTTPATPTVIYEETVDDTNLKNSLSKIKILVLGSDGKPRSINSNDYVLVSSLKILAVIVFNPNVKCIELKYDNDNVWKLERFKIGNLYPRSIVFKPDGYFYIDFDPFYYAYKFDSTTNKWVYNDESSYTGSGLLDPMDHPKYLNVFTYDDHHNYPKKIDTSKYKVYCYSNRMFFYIFDSNAKCMEFRFKDNNVVWKYDKNKHEGQYPRSISVDMSKYLAHFEFTDKVESFKLSEEELIQYPIKSDVMYFSKEDIKKYRIRTEGTPKNKDVSDGSDNPQETLDDSGTIDTSADPGSQQPDALASGTPSPSSGNDNEEDEDQQNKSTPVTSNETTTSS